MQQGNEGLIEDTLAAVQPWGFQLEAIQTPVLVMRGTGDKVVPPGHGAWLANRVPTAAVRTVPEAGHITVLDTAPAALAWLAALVHS